MNILRKALALLGLSALGIAASSVASAGTVTLYWHSADATTTGTLVLQTTATATGSLTDPNNFTIAGTSLAGVASAVQSFSYSWSGGTISSAMPYVVSAAAPTTAQVLAQLLSPATAPGSWVVSGGKLTSLFAITSTVTTGSSAGLYALVGGLTGLTGANNALSGQGAVTINPLTGTISLSGTAAQGYWSTTAVPLPATLPLLLSGLGLMGLRRRRTH